jgi:hypothetical protein
LLFIISPAPDKRLTSWKTAPRVVSERQGVARKTDKAPRPPRQANRQTKKMFNGR